MGSGQMLKSVLILSALHGLFVRLAPWSLFSNPWWGPQGQFPQRLLDSVSSLTPQERQALE